MFHKEDVEAYKSITAPDSLKERVLMADKQNVRTFPYRQLYLAVASFAVILSLSVTWNWNQSYISIRGNEQMVSMALEARAVPKTSISIDISSSHKRKVTVSEGSLYVGNAEGKRSVLAESGTELLWQLEAHTDNVYELKVTGWGKDKVYLLSYNQVNQNWELNEH